MAEKCILDASRDCIGYAEAVLLRKRIEDLEDWKEHTVHFQSDFHEYQKAQLEHDTKIDAKLEMFEKNLDKIIAWQESQQLKPAKRWESIVDKILMMVVGAVVAFMLGNIGL